MWLGLLGLHLVGNVGYNLLLRRSLLGNTDRWLLATILQTGIFVPAMLFAIVFPFKIPAYSSFELFLMAATVVLTVLFHAANVKSLQYLEASVFSVIYNTRFLTVSVLGIVLLSEKITLLQLLGGLLIFCSVFIVRQKEKFAVTKKGLFFGVSTAVIIAFLNVTEKTLNQHVGFLPYFVPVSIACTMLMWSIVLLRKTTFSPLMFIEPTNLLLMTLRAMSAFGFSYALVFGPIAVSNYIASLTVVLTVVLAALFLNERDYLKSKIVAAMVAFAGLTCILLSQF